MFILGVNIRYFVITIISIFLALGIGISIGFMFDAQEILTNERDYLIESLNKKFEELKLENKNHKNQITALINQNKSYKDFGEYIFPQLIKSRLTGITVGLIQLDNDCIYLDIIDMITMAGGEIIVINSMKDINSDSVFNNNLEDEIDYFIIRADCKEISITSMELLENFLNQDLTTYKNDIIAVKKDSVEFSYIDSFRSYNITTINNLDSIIGKLNLIFTLDKSIKDNQTKVIINNLINSTINDYNIGD